MAQSDRNRCQLSCRRFGVRALSLSFVVDDSKPTADDRATRGIASSQILSIFAFSTTSLQRLMSVAIRSVISFGEEWRASAPSPLIFSRTAVGEHARASRVEKLHDIVRHSLGPIRPNQAEASKPGTAASATVGASGKEGERLAVVTASARNLLKVKRTVRRPIKAARLQCRAGSDQKFSYK